MILNINEMNWDRFEICPELMVALQQNIMEQWKESANESRTNCFLSAIAFSSV